MLRRPPSFTRYDPPVPYPPLFRSLATPTPDAFAPGRGELLALQAVEIDQQARAELDRPKGADAVLADPDPAVGAGHLGSHGKEPAFVGQHALAADRQQVVQEMVRLLRVLRRGRDDGGAGNCQRVVADRKSTRLNSSH